MMLISADSLDQKNAAWKIMESVYPDLCERIPNLTEYRKKLFEKAHIVYAEENQSVLGIVAFYCNDNISKMAYISQIAVVEKFQNIGIGKMLLNKCEEISISSGMNYLRLEVRRENWNALRFYEKHGFMFEGDASDRSIYMAKKLESDSSML